MIKKWATVVSWRDNVVLVKYDIETFCRSCASFERCDNYIRRKIRLQNNHVISIYSKQPLVKGQKIELGIDEKSFLWFAMLIYISPIVGLFLVSSLFQILFGTDLAAICGSMLGMVSGFLSARTFFGKLIRRKTWKFIILSSVIVPDMLHIKMFSSKVK